MFSTSIKSRHRVPQCVSILKANTEPNPRVNYFCSCFQFFGIVSKRMMLEYNNSFWDSSQELKKKRAVNKVPRIFKISIKWNTNTWTGQIYKTRKYSYARRNRHCSRSHGHTPMCWECSVHRGMRACCFYMLVAHNFSEDQTFAINIQLS